MGLSFWLLFIRSLGLFVAKLWRFYTHQLLVLVSPLDEVSDFIHRRIVFAGDTEAIPDGNIELAEWESIDILLSFRVECLVRSFLRCFTNSENDLCWRSYFSWSRPCVDIPLKSSRALFCGTSWVPHRALCRGSPWSFAKNSRASSVGKLVKNGKNEH